MDAMLRMVMGASLAAALIAAPAGAQTAAPADNEAAVRAALDHYLTAHATGVGEHIGMVFHEEAMLYWVADDQLQRRSGAEYQAGFRGTPAADEAQRKRWIEMVDVTGDVAIAKVVLDYPNGRFTDYFALARTDGEWRVMTKLFQRESPRP